MLNSKKHYPLRTNKMKIAKVLEEYKNKILGNLQQTLENNPLYLESINNWGKDAIKRLEEFSSKGKLLRGSLILFCSDMYSGKTLQGAIEAAIAIELIHSSLLIHDDIMDRDNLRRGNPTIHYQYINFYPNSNQDQSNALHFGESMAICLGDIGFFIAFYILSMAKIDSKIVNRIIRLWTKELSLVGTAQMDDMYFETADKEISEEKILNMYRYKTSRYTFSLPMATGAILANASEKDIENLEKLGEKMGIIFQIKDDELGLFGNEGKIGKSAGSDIKEGKNTIYISYLKRFSSGANKEVISDIIKRKDNSSESLEKLRSIIISSGIKGKIDNIVERLKEEASCIIRSLNIDKNYQILLNELNDYIYKRDK